MVDDYGGPSRPLIAKKNWTLEGAAQRQNAGKKTGRNGFERQLAAGAPAGLRDEGPFVFGVHSPSHFPGHFPGRDRDPALRSGDARVRCKVAAKGNAKSGGSIKCLLLGDGAVGKTSMITSYAKKSFEFDYKPTTFDNYNVNVYVDQTPIKLEFLDTSGQDSLEGLRKKVCYPEADVVLLCFSVVIPESFRSIESRWIPRASEIKAPIILVGTQSDLRDNAETMNMLRYRGENAIYDVEARRLASRLNVHYIETSSRTSKGLKDAFDSAILAALPKYRKKKSLWKQIFCLS